MAYLRGLPALLLIALLLPLPAGAQQSGSLPPDTPKYVPAPVSPEKIHPLEELIYRKEREEEAREEVERKRRLREMEAKDNQRRLVKRQLMNVQCTWKFDGGKTVTKVFKRRIAPSCEKAISDLSSDLKRPLSADCSCTGASPVASTD